MHLWRIVALGEMASVGRARNNKTSSILVRCRRDISGILSSSLVALLSCDTNSLNAEKKTKWKKNCTLETGREIAVVVARSRSALLTSRSHGSSSGSIEPLRYHYFSIPVLLVSSEVGTLISLQKQLVYVSLESSLLWLLMLFSTSKTFKEGTFFWGSLLGWCSANFFSFRNFFFWLFSTYCGLVKRHFLFFEKVLII